MLISSMAQSREEEEAEAEAEAGTGNIIPLSSSTTVSNNVMKCDLGAKSDP